MIDNSIFQSERTLLATLMQRPSDCAGVDILPIWFSNEQHADICRAVQDLTQDGQPADPVSVMDYFERQGRNALASLAVSIAGEYPVTASPEAYGHRVMMAWRQRQARDIGATLIESTEPTAVDDAIRALMDLHAVERQHEWTSKQAAQAAFKELVAAHESGGKLPGVTTGLADVDDKLGGLHRGDLIVVGGRAAMGKTAYLINMALSAAKSGVPVGVISGEQPIEQIALRMMSSEARVPAKKFRSAQFDEAEWPKVYGAATTTTDLPMWFLDRSSPSITEVARVARRWKHKYGIQALYVDYIQRLGGRGERKWEQVADVVTGLKNLARDLDIPVAALAQVSRAVEGRADHTPRMGDLSDSSQIEKEADQVIMLYREGYYDASAPQNMARAIIEKNRHGPTGYVDLHWDGEIMTFGDLAREYA